MRRVRRILLNVVTAVSLVLCVGAVVCWRLSFTRRELGFDLVHWDGDDRAFLDYGLAVRCQFGRLDLRWIRIRGDVAPTRVIDEDVPFVAADHPPQSDDNMPGVGDARADRGGPPGRLNLVAPDVWDFPVRQDRFYESDDLVDTSWGLYVGVERNRGQWPSAMAAARVGGG